MNNSPPPSETTPSRHEEVRLATEPYYKNGMSRIRVAITEIGVRWCSTPPDVRRP